MKKYELSTDEIKKVAHEAAMKEVSRLGIIGGESERFVEVYTDTYNGLRQALEDYVLNLKA